MRAGVARSSLAARTLRAHVILAGAAALLAPSSLGCRCGSLEAPAMATGVWRESMVLTAIDDSWRARSGTDVAVSGDTAVVGAPGQVSAVDVFVRTDATWRRQTRIAAAEAGRYDRFGAAVAVSGDTVVVGAPDYDGVLGAVYVFVRVGDVWQEVALLRWAGARRQGFGEAVAVSGDTVLVGVRDAALVYERTAAGWEERARLAVAVAPASYGGVAAVALSGDTALVGVDDPGGVGHGGAAYVFVRAAAVWREQARFGGQPEFGESVALWGDTAAVGDPAVEGPAIHVFVRRDAAWSEHASLTAPEEWPAGSFGGDVSLEGDLLATSVSENTSTGTRGAVYVFARDEGTWASTARLLSPGDRADDGFGAAVGVSEGTVVVGAPWSDALGAGEGTAYAFARSGASFDLAARLSTPHTSTFGTAVALAGDLLVIGDADDDFEVERGGSAHVFSRADEEGWEAETFAAPLLRGTRFGTSVAISTEIAVIGGSSREAHVVANLGGSWVHEALLESGGDDAERVALADELAAVVGPRAGACAASTYQRAWTARGIYEWTPQGTVQTVELSDRPAGCSVALSGARVLVAAHGGDDVERTGAVQSFSRASGTWQDDASLVPSDATGEFGGSLALSGDTAAVGAPTQAGAGVVYVFARGPEGWREQARLRPPESTPNARFGASVAVWGDVLAASAPGSLDASGRSGPAHVFHRTGTTWTHEATLAGPGPASAVALSGPTAVVGSAARREAYVYVRTPCTRDAACEAGDCPRDACDGESCTGTLPEGCREARVHATYGCACRAGHRNAPWRASEWFSLAVIVMVLRRRARAGA